MNSKTKIVNFSDHFKEIKGMADPEPSKFKPCHEIFPYWDDCENILTDWICRCGWWKITKILYGMGYDISLDLPHIAIVPGEMALIINGLTIDYIPTHELMPLLNTSMSRELDYKIKTIIANREKYIISIGGRPVLKELGFRLGVNVFK